MANIVGTYVADTATIQAGAQLGFKLGLESKLTSSSFTATNGTFYLTSDTHRLYIGDKDGNVCPVNQGVIKVTSLPSRETAIPGQFYYMSDSNILATVSGNQWVQINPDTYVNKVDEGVTAGTANDVTITTKITHGGGKSDTKTSDGFVIKGGGDNKVSVSGKTITITDADYGMSASGDNTTGVSVNLMKTAAGDTEKVKDKVTFKSGTGIKLSVSGDEITIDGTELATGSSQGEIKSAVFSNEAEGFKLTLTKGSGSKLEPTFSPVINYGSAPSTAKFANGTATLDVYTQAETDKKIESALMSFNALTYKGTVGGSSGATLTDLTAATSVHNGDVYMATGNANITVNGTAGAYDAGTLFIAQGTEDSSGVIPAAGITWTVVQNYNTDTQTQVDLITNGIKISKVVGSNPATELGSLVINSGTTDILDVSEKTAGKQKQLTISHKSSSYAATAAPDRAAQGSDLYAKKVITGITGDSYGHLKTSKEEWFVVPTEVFKETTITDSVTVDGTVATLSHALELQNSSSHAQVSKATVSTKISSDTLEVKANSNVLEMNLVWGSF